MDKRERFRRKFNAQFMDEDWQKRQRISKIVTGLLIIAAGILIMLKQMGIFIPHWILSWKMLLIAIGFLTLIKHKFKNTGGYIMIMIGTAFLLKDIVPGWIDPKFIWPVIIIGVGILIIAKTIIFDPKKKMLLTDEPPFRDVSSEDFIQASAFFGGVTKSIFSKNFKGASISSVFGGTEINLIQTDFEGEATIDLTCVFGGTTLIIPSDWKVKSDLTSVFGGIEDKRMMISSALINESKTLILKGTCVFGGIELHSYE
jgi:predicted membrane protein